MNIFELILLAVALYVATMVPLGILSWAIARYLFTDSQRAAHHLPRRREP